MQTDAIYFQALGEAFVQTYEVVRKRPFERVANTRFAALIARSDQKSGRSDLNLIQKPRLTPPTYQIAFQVSLRVSR